MAKDKNKKAGLEKDNRGNVINDEYSVNSEPVEKALRKFRRRSEEQEASDLAKKLNYPYIDLSIFPADQESIRIIEEKDSMENSVVVVRKQERNLAIATTNPESLGVKKIIRKLQDEYNFQIEVLVVSQSSVKRAQELYKKNKLVEVFDYLRARLTGGDLENFEKDIRQLVDLERRISELPTTEILNVILAGAMKLRASDIHFEPQKDGKVRLRYRIDGVLQIVAEFPTSSYPTILARIKIMSKMLLNVKDNAQDGRFSIALDDNNEVDLRVSVLPGNHGETVVIRLLGQGINSSDFDALGLIGLAQERLIEESNKKQGMIINSGPTGSGKTTTLYSVINRVNTPDKKVVSIEDPIEYQVKGVSQTQVESERDYTFSNGLRAIVRQDPDIILVGEIRDEETAEIAVHAALTGHLVLTTIHSKSSAGVVGRMIDLGIKPAIIASAVNAFIAQRLVRELCHHCKEKYVPAEETVTVLKKMLSLISPRSKVEVPKKIEHLYRSKGCAKCQGLGYQGRIGVFEIMTINDEIRGLMEKMATEDEIRIAALEAGMVTYEQDGLVKAIMGKTSLEELQRVVGTGDYLMNIYEKIVTQSLSRGILISKKTTDKIKNQIGNEEDLKKVIENASTRESINYILAAGLLMRAGDIHIEPGEKFFKVRYRIDGILHDIVRFPMSEFLSVLSEVKSLSGFKTQQRQGVIDGRFRITIDQEVEEVQDKNVDVRVSVILGGFGDIVVMRLLNQSAQATNLDKIRLIPYNLKKIKHNASKPNGLILNTGPTGHGKSTTLYSILSYLNKPELKIITVEDPIEYQINGILQTQVSEEEKYTFATAIRALLRQNPDIMMIGEIRDDETAAAAYQAALTGHLVLSTLHTNSAAGSVQRLLNMGLSMSDLITGTNCFMAQRLARRLCPDCHKKVPIQDYQRSQIEQLLGKIPAEIKKDLNIPSVTELYQPVGCEKCNQIGYKGRIPLSEVIEITEPMEEFLSTRPTTSKIKEMALKEGMIMMSQDGIIRALQGETSFSEVARVTKEVEELGAEEQKQN